MPDHQMLRKTFFSKGIDDAHGEVNQLGETREASVQRAIPLGCCNRHEVHASACGCHMLSVCLQVPQLACLTALEMLHLRENRAPNRKGVKRLRNEGGVMFLPKMAITESSLRWMLQCRYLQHVRRHYPLIIVTDLHASRLSTLAPAARVVFMLLCFVDIYVSNSHGWPDLQS